MEKANITEEGKVQISSDASSQGSPTPILNDSSSMEKKNESSTHDSHDDSDAPRSNADYPQGWKLWLVYIATLLTMFLVSANFISSSEGRTICTNYSALLP